MRPAEDPCKEEGEREASREQRLARHRGLPARHAQAHAASPNAAAATAAAATAAAAASAAAAAASASAAGAAGCEHGGVGEQEGGALREGAGLAHCEAALGAGERRTLQRAEEKEREQHACRALGAYCQLGERGGRERHEDAVRVRAWQRRSRCEEPRHRLHGARECRHEQRAQCAKRCLGPRAHQQQAAEEESGADAAKCDARRCLRSTRARLASLTGGSLPAHREDSRRTERW